MNALSAFVRARPLRFGLAADLHPDRWGALGVPETGAARLTGCPRALAALSERLDWLSPGADDFTGWDAALSDRPGAWALLPGAALWRAGRRLGAGRYRAEIVRLIRREDVASFKAAAGDDVYRFALRQVPVLWRGAPLAGEAEPGSDETLAGRVFYLGTDRFNIDTEYILYYDENEKLIFADITDGTRFGRYSVYS